jgi:putative membrane-bound dehydrogenase-like protein
MPLTPLLRMLATKPTRAMLAAAAALSALSLPALAQKSPEETVKSLEVAPGLEATVFASEPMLMKPANIDVDANGRVWVCEGVDYRAWAHLRPEGDRVLILQDTQGTGNADKATVFYQGKELACPLGICVLGNKTIVSNAPNVYVFTDTDGDGKADKKEILFTGIKGVQHDHAIHTFVFGPDGKLYFNMGNEAQQLLRPNGSPVKDVFGNIVQVGKPGTKAGTADKVAYRQGCVFRMNPDGTDVEVLANNFRNNFEVNVDSFGTLWQSDNDDDGNRGVRINYVMEYGNFGFTDEITGAGWSVKRTNLEKEIPLRHWHQNDPGVIPNLLQTGAGSPCGICIYEGNLLPQVFQNQMIHCDPGPNVVRSYVVNPAGAGYSGKIVNILQGTTDKQFRPSDVCVAPDGSLIVSDWYDPQVGGHGMQDNKYPNMHGRIYRVAPPGTPYKIPPMDLKTPDGAAEALTSPNLARRYLAWTALHEMGDNAEHALLKLWSGDNPRFRARALWLLTKIEGKGRQYVEAAIKDKDADIRITGLRAARQLKDDVIPVVRQLAHDENPQVRRECAIALHYNKSSEMPELWAELAAQHDGKDRWYVEALGIGAADRDVECLAAYMNKVPDAWNTTPGRDVIWRNRAPQAAGLLAKIILDPATSDDERPRFIRALDFIPDCDSRNDALMSLLTSSLPDQRLPIEALSRLRASKTGNVPPLTQELNRVLDAHRGTAEFVDLCELLDVKDRHEDLIAYALAHPNDSAGAAAAKLMLKHGNRKLIESRLTGENAASLVTALGNVADGSATPILTAVVTTSTYPLPLRQAAVKGLAHSRNGAIALLDLAKKKTLPADVSFQTGYELRNSTIQEARSQAAELFPPPVAKDAKPLPPVSILIKMKGDARSGKVIYAANCIRCHQVNGEGVDFGPNLSEIGTKLPKDALCESILSPSSAISFGYEGKTIKLKSGDQADGILTSQTPEELTLKTSTGATAIQTKYKRSDVAQIVDMKTSIMPDGLQSAMTTQEFVDLIEYLSTLKKK